MAESTAADVFAAHRVVEGPAKHIHVHAAWIRCRCGWRSERAPEGPPHWAEPNLLEDLRADHDRHVLAELAVGGRDLVATSAAILRAFADAREVYLSPSERESGAFHELSASKQWLICEIDAYRKAATVIEDPIEAAQLTLPTWKLDGWPETVAAIRAAAAEAGDAS